MEVTKLDIVVLGATGFTGVLVVKCLSKIVDLKWGIAGRSSEKLQKLVDDLKNNGLDVSKIPVFNVDVNNKDLLRNTTSRAKVLLNCVGPNTVFSKQIVEACIESRTHYIDISAEINHILDIYRKHHKAAENANVLVIPSCGFASIPAASGLLHMEEHFEGTLNAVECYVELDIPRKAYFPWPGNCLIHYGTWESMVYVLKYMKEYTRMKQETFPESIGETPQDMNRKFFHRNLGRLWYPYPGPDETVIEFSERYLHEHHNKRPVHFKMYTTMPLLIHFIIIPLMFLYYYLCYFDCFSNLLRKYPRFFTAGYMSHKGPSEKMMQGVKYSLTLIGKGWDSSRKDFSKPTDKIIKYKVSSCDGYKTTAIAMVVAAITLLKDRTLMPKGGVINVGAAFRGTNLVNRLKNNNINYDLVA